MAPNPICSTLNPCWCPADAVVLSSAFTPEFPGLPTSYFIKYNVHYPCNASSPPGDEESCFLPNSAPRPGYIMREDTMYIQVEHWVYMAWGRFRRTDKVMPHDPTQRIVDVINPDAGLVLSYQVHPTALKVRPHLGLGPGERLGTLVRLGEISRMGQGKTGTGTETGFAFGTGIGIGTATETGTGVN